MKVAVIGSRSLNQIDIEKHLPDNVSEIVSGGAKGVDSCAKEYAYNHHLKFTEFIPDYRRYKRAAPLYRNLQIVEYADEVLAFWDGKSQGTKHVIRVCREKKKKIVIIVQK